MLGVRSSPNGKTGARSPESFDLPLETSAVLRICYHIATETTLDFIDSALRSDRIG